MFSKRETIQLRRFSAKGMVCDCALRSSKGRLRIRPGRTWATESAALRQTCDGWYDLIEEHGRRRQTLIAILRREDQIQLVINEATFSLHDVTFCRYRKVSEGERHLAMGRGSLGH